MRGILLICGMLLAFNTAASKITMNNPDEQELKGGKMLCTYENSIYLFTLVTRSQSCPYSKTFDTSDSEK
ncbi:hypothetical protein [Enterobacter sp.]|uniref:hypothetical protein n=1 Tax=Enterobacter sp. TaxID=42895 RepID=UPI00296EC76C|nr:hypothetical protein [Enterobacter sp.]